MGGLTHLLNQDEIWLQQVHKVKVCGDQPVLGCVEDVHLLSVPV